MTRRKKKIQSSHQKPPDLWEWVWSKLPNWVRPIALIVGIVLIAATSLLGLAEKTKNVFGWKIEPTPTEYVMWTEPVAYHIVREYLSFNGCAHDIRISNQSTVDEYIASIAKEGSTDTFRKNSYPITPAMLVTNFWHTHLSEFDVLKVTKLSMEIIDYEPITDFNVLILEMSTCASQLLPGAQIWHLNIDPRQKLYDVLHPRTTSPSTISVAIPRGAPDGIGIEVNGMQPGIYKLSVEIEYDMNGHHATTEPLLFTIAVPDESQIRSVYEFDMMGTWSQLPDPQPFLDEWRTNTYERNLSTEYYQIGEALDGQVGQYTYIVNLGKDIDLTGWKLIEKTSPNDKGTVYFTFPIFILKSGSGIRIWNLNGNNTPQDLFGANNLQNLNTDDTFYINLLDTNLERVSGTWVTP